MNIGKSHSPILVTGAERSGSTLIAKIIDLCGAKSGVCNGMFENKMIVDFNNEMLHTYDFPYIPPTDLLLIPVNWYNTINGVKIAQMGENPYWFVKHSTLARLWPVYHHAFPNAKWVIVRRRTGDIIQSCIKTGYMTQFKSKDNLDFVGFENETEGWLWWVREYEQKFIEMIQAGVNCKIIWPERMVTGDFEQIYEMVEWLGLKWNNKIPEVITPLLEKSRRAEQWQEQQ
jgi:hypothetical protein